MNTQINEQRLDTLAKRIERLDVEAVEAERAAKDLHDDERTCAVLAARAVETRAELERELRAYFIESEFIRKGELARVAA